MYVRAFLLIYRITDAGNSNTGDDESTRPRWLTEEDQDQDQDQDQDPSTPAIQKKDRSDTQKSTYNGTRQNVYHLMQLGAGKKTLNPWFRAFLASLIDNWPGISTDDFQRTWFDLTEEERQLDYRWEAAGRPDDEGFVPGFNLPVGTDTVSLRQNPASSAVYLRFSPQKNDDLADGVDLLLQTDGSIETILALKKDAVRIVSLVKVKAFTASTDEHPMIGRGSFLPDLSTTTFT